MRSEGSAAPHRTYRAFGLTIASDFELPELEAMQATGTPDLVIRAGRLDGPLPETDDFREIGLGTDGSVYFAWSRLGRMLVAATGREVVVDLLPVADMGWLGFPLLGPVMATVLHRRGQTVLHGSAVTLQDGRAILFVGDNGAGKSTLAAAFLRSGYRLMTDDVIALAVEPDGARVLPAFPAIKLGAVAGERLAPLPATPLPGTSRDAAKRRWRLDSFDPSAAPLACIFELRRTRSQRDIAVQPLDAAGRLAMLMRFTYLPKLGAMLASGSFAPTHFMAAARLADVVPASVLTISDDLDQLLGTPERIAALVGWN